jgi:hypothetical protein
MRGPRAVALLGAVVLGLGGTTAAHAAKIGSASGAGALDGGQRHFSFSVKQNADGTAKGQAELTNKLFTGENGTSPYKLHIDISCMKSFGNTAYFGGTTKSTNDPNLVDAVYFAVQDNGEPGKSVDKISRVFFFDDDTTKTGDPQLCQGNAVGDFPLEPIENGNIQVK